MDMFTPLASTLDDVRDEVRSGSFPGMSSDESDAFSLGFWAGAMALAIGATEDNLTAVQIAERVESELRRIGSEGPA